MTDTAPSLVRIAYVGPFDAVEIAETAQVVERGGTVEVTEDLALRLLDQPSNWSRPKPAKNTKGND